MTSAWGEKERERRKKGRQRKRERGRRKGKRMTHGLHMSVGYIFIFV
jgi:hypothetical protein